MAWSSRRNRIRRDSRPLLTAVSCTIPGVVTPDVHADSGTLDPVLDDATVLGVARRHVPDARAVLAVDESGGEARTYALESDRGDLILKTQRPHRVRPRTSLEKETAFLRHLADSSHQHGPDAEQPLPVPRVLGYRCDGALEYILMTRLPGVAAGRAPLSGPA